MGMYEDPKDLMGFYSWNLLRAGRLVVDTGMHAFGWSKEVEQHKQINAFPLVGKGRGKRGFPIG